MPIIEGHHDFSVLERRLGALIREAQGDRGAALPPPIALVAPTARLLNHLRQALAADAPALLNVHFFHHESFARAGLVAAGRPAPEPVSDEVRSAILARVVESRGGELAAYVRSRPGSVASILATLDDLREACVPGDVRVPDGAMTGRGREMLEVHGGFARELDVPDGGLFDRASKVRRALPFMGAFARRFRLIVHYGAYDLIGVNCELMRAAEASGARTVFLVAHHPESRAYEAARRFWPEFLDARPSALTSIATE